MKVMTILGTRPEIIRLSRIIPLLDEQCEHVLVHTGQNYDICLSGQFFEEMEIRPPDITFGPPRGISDIVWYAEKALKEQQPDRVLILGDTNSGLSALVAKRMGIPVYHLEAGNRCYDDRVPEEVNRRVIDHCSDVLMPYTERSRANLLREGIPGERIYVVGNPIQEVLVHYWPQAVISDALGRLGLSWRKYILATAHRAETVDDPEMFSQLCYTLTKVAQKTEMPVVLSLHPHTKARLGNRSIIGVQLIKPPGFFGFVRLEMSAACVLTDSGTVQEECCMNGVPCVTLRDVTERPETIECGAGTLAGINEDSVCSAVKHAIKAQHDWTPPPEYKRTNVSTTVVRIVLGK